MVLEDREIGLGFDGRRETVGFGRLAENVLEVSLLYAAVQLYFEGDRSLLISSIITGRSKGATHAEHPCPDHGQLFLHWEA